MNRFQIEDIVKQPMGKRKRPFQIEDIHDICDFLWFFTQINPEFSKNNGATNHFQVEDSAKEPMGKRKRPFQREDIYYMCISHIFTTIIENTIVRQTIFK